MNVLQQALEALEMLTESYDDNAVGIEIDAIHALRKALEQEPVAWMWTINNGGGYSSRGIGFEKTDIPFAAHTPLYTHPQPKREPLTHEDFLDWYDNAHWGNEDFKQSCERAFEAGWQAAHGIKGEA